MTLSTDLTTNRCRQIADSRTGGSRERLPHSYVQDSWSRSVDSARWSLLRPGTLTGFGALAMGNEERVEQSSHRCLLVRSEQFRGFEGQFQTPVVTKPTGAKNQFVARRRKGRRQLSQHTKRRLGFTRLVQTDLIREYVKGLGERRLGETALTAQRGQILGKTHESLYRLRAAYEYVILILSV